MGSTLPTDTVPLANALRDCQEALASGKDRDQILVEIIKILSEPELITRLDRILKGRR